MGLHWFHSGFVGEISRWRGELRKGDSFWIALLMLSIPHVQILQEYVRLVEDVETKLNLAMKYKCHDVVIDVSIAGMRWGGDTPSFCYVCCKVCDWSR